MVIRVSTDPAEIAKTEMVVVIRVGDLPIPYVPASMVVCDGPCGIRCWIANTSPKGKRNLCVQCAKTEIEAQGGEADLIVNMTERAARSMDYASPQSAKFISELLHKAAQKKP